MAASLEDQLIDKVRALPPDKQQEALRLLDSLANGATPEPNGPGVERRPIWEVVDEINPELPSDTWENVPTDGSINLDHYLYGAPKQIGGPYCGFSTFKLKRLHSVKMRPVLCASAIRVFCWK